MNKAKLLGSDDELVAAALRLLWDLDTFLADAAADRLGRLSPPDRSTLFEATRIMRETLAAVRLQNEPAGDPIRMWPGSSRP